MKSFLVFGRHACFAMGVLVASMSAFADKPDTPPGKPPELADGALTNVACSNGDVSPTALGCAGFYSGNVVAGEANGGDAGRAAIFLDAFGVISDGDELLTFTSTPGNDVSGAGSVDFGTTLYGKFILGVHWGNGAFQDFTNPDYTGKGGGSAFYLFDGGSTGVLAEFDLLFSDGTAENGSQGFSTAVIYGGVPGEDPRDPPAEVPEPGVLGLVGLGLAGLAFARRNRRIQ